MQFCGPQGFDVREGVVECAPGFFFFAAACACSQDRERSGAAFFTLRFFFPGNGAFLAVVGLMADGRSTASKDS